jgi:hypothetical protein
VAARRDSRRLRADPAEEEGVDEATREGDEHAPDRDREVRRPERGDRTQREDPGLRIDELERRGADDACVSDSVGGEFRFVTDWPDYAAWTLKHLARAREFEWTAERADDWRLPWSGFTSTRYEAKAKREGRTPAYFIFRRN